MLRPHAAQPAGPVDERRLEVIRFAALHGRAKQAFDVRSVLEVMVHDGGLGGFALVERAVEPWTKDYDVDGERPASWAARFDVSAWGLVSAWEGAVRIGGAVIAFDTPGLHMLEGRRDLAVLWDLRVAPERRLPGEVMQWTVVRPRARASSKKC